MSPAPDSVTAYEVKFANLVGATRAIAFAYSRHGLISVLSAAGLRAGDEVVLSPLTCKVVPLALLSLNLKPVYADISAPTLNLDPRCVESAIGSATRAVLFQHTYGNSAGVEAVAKIAFQKGVLMFEDCAQCMPLAASNQCPGYLSEAAIFSNNLRKPLPAGSGGVAVTRNAKLARKVQEIRDSLPHRGVLAELLLRMEIWLHKHLLRPALYWPLFEFNRKWSTVHRVTSLDAEIENEITNKTFQISDYQLNTGSIWLDDLESYVAHRRLCCVEYSEALSDLESMEQPFASMAQPFYYFPVLVEHKDKLLHKARRRCIELIAWPLRTPIYPIVDSSDLRTYGYQPGSCPVAEDVANRLVGLPTDICTREHHRRAIVALLKEHHRSDSAK